MQHQRERFEGQTYQVSVFILLSVTSCMSRSYRGGGVIDQPSVIISAWAGHISEISAEMSDRTNRVRSSAGISATLKYKNCV